MIRPFPSPPNLKDFLILATESPERLGAFFLKILVFSMAMQDKFLGKHHERQHPCI